MLKVFEAFSGIGAQHMALNELGMDYKIVATSEIDQGAIKAYYAIHGENKKVKKEPVKVMTDYLKNIGLLNIDKIINKSEDEIYEIYNACKISNNLGDISKIKAEDIPNHDLFTYSFPCQDISSVGKMSGFEKGSGTRSSLLWECQKVIKEKKPKYLLLENVKNLATGKNKECFMKWLNFLENEGYDNYWKVCDAKDYGIPQRRPRVIVVSKYGRSKTNLLKDNEFKKITIKDIIKNVDEEWTKFVPKACYKNEPQKGEILFLDDRDWNMNGVMISDVCSTQRAGRIGLKLIKNENNKLMERKLTALECCRLMGFPDKSYNNMKKNNISDNNIMRFCGNSIVVNVLKNAFLNIQEEENID